MHCVLYISYGSWLSYCKPRPPFWWDGKLSQVVKRQGWWMPQMKSRNWWRNHWVVMQSSSDWRRKWPVTPQEFVFYLWPGQSWGLEKLSWYSSTALGLEHIKDTEMKARIQGIATEMKNFDYFFGISLDLLILWHTDNLSRIMQRADMSAIEDQVVTGLTLSTWNPCGMNQMLALICFGKGSLLQRKIGMLTSLFTSASLGSPLPWWCVSTYL